MGRITDITTGAISGRVGPAVYYKMKGKAYVRAAMGRAKKAHGALNRREFVKR